LKTVADNDYMIFFEHDFTNELCTLKNTDRGVKLDETFSFNEVFGSI
jgi:hypothetical protein